MFLKGPDPYNLVKAGSLAIKLLFEPGFSVAFDPDPAYLGVFNFFIESRDPTGF